MTKQQIQQRQAQNGSWHREWHGAQMPGHREARLQQERILDTAN